MTLNDIIGQSLTFRPIYGSSNLCATETTNLYGRINELIIFVSLLSELVYVKAIGKYTPDIFMKADIASFVMKT